MTDVRAIVEAQIASGSTLGVGAVAWREGKPYLRVVAGEARPGEALADDAIFLWLSSGKPVTAAAVALLHERGSLLVDDPVQRWLPEFGVNGKAGVTIRHLLSHTAGLQRVLTSAWEVSGWAETVERICASPLAPGFVPGEHAAYDPVAAWFILAEIIAQAAGESFEAFVGREIFDRCGMRSASFSLCAERARVLAPKLAGYWQTASQPAQPLGWNQAPATDLPRPGASLRCSLDDLARFYEALRTGQLLQAATRELFTRDARGLRHDRTFGVPMKWGLGFMVKGDPRLPYSFSPEVSERAFGHGGQQSSIAFTDPERGCTVAVAYNGLPGERPHQVRVGELLRSILK